MVRLEEREYERVRPVFEGLRYNLVVDSVIDGNTPAWVYADDAREPRTAWMWNRMDAMLVAGRADDDAFNRALGEMIGEKAIPDARRRHIPELTLHYHPEAWEGRIDALLPGGRLEKGLRRYYAFGSPKADWRRGIPPSCEMRRIDEELLASAQLQNVRQVVGWVRSFWRSDRDFAQTGFGFCLLQGDAVVSWCLSVFVSGKDFELGIATAPEHRGRGYATLMAAACVGHCVEKGLTPHWHCWEDNRPSIAVAEKVGFENPTRYTVYRLYLVNTLGQARS